MRFKHLLFTTLLIFLSCLAPAAAYVDPGSGSFLAQMLVAGAMGALYYVKTSWYRIKSIFTKKEEKPEEKAEAKADEETEDKPEEDAGQEKPEEEKV